MKNLLYSAVALCLLAGAGVPSLSFAQKSKTASSAPFSIKKINARRVPGITTAGAVKEVSFEIIWNSKTTPNKIFYRKGKSEWLDCTPSIPEKKAFGGGPNDFMLLYRNVRFDEFKPGDHITLTADRHGHEPMPGTVRPMQPDALYYQLANSSKWYSIKVNVPKLPPLK